MSEDGGDSEREVIVTPTAKSKAFRMIPSAQIEVMVARGLKGKHRGRIYRRGDSNEYHLIAGDYAIVTRIDPDGTVVVVTQMHQHHDYRGDGTWMKVDAVDVDD